MYISKINPEDKPKYTTYTTNNKTFYKLKKINSPIKKLKYSSRFTEPSFIKQETFRKLNMIKNFRAKYNDFDYLIDKWKCLIERALDILKYEINMPMYVVFKVFELGKYGFLYEDYGNNSEVEDNN